MLNQHLIPLNLYSVSINTILFTNFIIVSVSFIQQNIRKDIDYKRPLSTKQKNIVQHICIETCK